MAKKLDMPMDKVICCIDRHANTSAASVPLALSEGVSDGRIVDGNLVLFEAIGGGLAWGAGLVRMGYPKWYWKIGIGAVLNKALLISVWRTNPKTLL